GRSPRRRFSTARRPQRVAPPGGLRWPGPAGHRSRRRLPGYTARRRPPRTSATAADPPVPAAPGNTPPPPPPRPPWPADKQRATDQPPVTRLPPRRDRRRPGHLGRPRRPPVLQRAGRAGDAADQRPCTLRHRLTASPDADPPR